MYLKGIEVQGFKSFAHKMNLDFHNGITAIVGPNGSGKSNVADAVRWVLGEQRIKQLRGGSMQDVIFSGTENRRPVSYATVAITLDNTDQQLPINYNEVTITRKLYRSGESEYLINGSIVRLKDINELFYDTGIGKEGYSIIGQGQIDKILSGKPEDRRELFDEAAGIVKFKKRKNATLKKLDEEQQNLLRVNDILTELTRQHGPLEKQAEVAKDFLKKKEELKIYDINMFLLEMDRLEDLVNKLNVQHENTLDEHKKATEEFDAMTAEYNAVEEEVDLVDDKNNQAKNQLNTTNIMRQQRLGEIDLLKEKIRSLRMNDEHFATRANTVQQELDQRKEQMDSYLAEMETLSNELEKSKKDEQAHQTKVLEIQGEIAASSSKLEHCQESMLALLNNRADTMANIQRLDSKLEQIYERKSLLDEQSKASHTDLEKQNLNLSTFSKELEAVNSEIEKDNAICSKYEEQISNWQEQITVKGEELQALQQDYHKKNSRLESLQNLVERYEGYSLSIKKVMEQKATHPDVIGVVADIIKVDKKYETAIEVALGGSIQNIVTKDENAAKKMIAFLKENKLGRATFLPLTNLSPRKGNISDSILKEKGVIGLAHELVTVESSYKGVAEALLRSTLVVDTIDTAIILSRKNHHSLRIVTTSGELFNPGGSISGGAYKHASNLLSRRSEMEKAEKEIKTLSKKLSILEGELAEVKKKRASTYALLDAKRESMKETYVRQNTTSMNYNQVEAKISFIQETLQLTSVEIQNLDLQLTEISDNQESIQVELEVSKDLESSLLSQTEEQQAIIDALRTNEQEALKQSEAIHLVLANIEQNYAHLSENIFRIQGEQDKFQQELFDLEENQGNADLEIKEKETEISDLKKAVENSIELIAEIEAEIQEFQKQKELLNIKHKEFWAKRGEITDHRTNLEKEMIRVSSKIEGYLDAIEKQKDYMWEEYEITLSQAKNLRDGTLTELSPMKKRISELKIYIKNLGSVNVNAIEEFKELSERLTFLQTQHDDIVTAEATLLKIIEELDVAMRKQFSEQFSQIAESFNKVFKELFGGGKGTLELMEDEDILEAGVRIIAQPPGKKLQNMMQLSGGEKSLTAIALLFAIQNLKPSPFCLLDEIEAALDDSNVIRFAKYLQKLSGNIQFIVITHRRGTMGAADRLYGITMQEKGVSALVSVDLLDDKLSP